MKSVLKERLLKICDVAMLCSSGEVSIFKNTWTYYFLDLILEIIFIFMRYFLSIPG